MRAETTPERLLVSDAAPQRLLGSAGEGREGIPPEASGGVRWRSATARWGSQDSRLFLEGWLSVPNKFLRCYSSLNPPLSSGEALFVLQLMTFKWDDAAPFPSYGRIAKTMGVTDKMARRYAQSLQKKGYLIRQFQKRAPNKFDLTRLFDALAEVRLETASEGRGAAAGEVQRCVAEPAPATDETRAPF
jgi:Helix-turn-helix domain